MPFGLSFTNPWALLLLPPLAAYFVWLGERSLADLSVIRRRIAIGVRLLVVSSIVLALAGIQIVRFNRDQATIFLLDYSDSINPATKARAEKIVDAAIHNKFDNDKAGIVVFGREAYVDMAPTQVKDIPKIQTVVPSEFTDISSAIRLGMASLPEGMDRRLVLLSDGNENLGDAFDEAVNAANNGVKIDVIPLTENNQHEVLLERLTLPGEAKVGEPIEVKVVARSTGPADGKINLFRDGVLLGSKQVHMEAGKNVFVFPQTVGQAGTARFEARIEPAKGTDTNPENNVALGFVNVQGQPRVLLVSNEPDQSQFLITALAKEKVNVEMRGPGGLPADLSGMQPYDSIVLDNVPAWDLSADQMLSLQAYVRDLGCGLVMIGGDNSFGPGGYRATPVEETLPVSMDIKEMQYIPGGAVAMIMHSCEFPDGNDWAKSVCSQVTRQLGDNDYAGLIVFGMDANWVYDAPGMLKVGPNRNYMLTTIRGIDPGDMPDFDAALNVAYGGLTSTHAYLKHCIILSDGDPAPPEPDLVKKFNDARITVSTVVIQPHDPSGAQNMWEIAKEHGGRFYSVRSPDEIPNIFLKEAATISRSAIIEDPFVPQITADSTIIKGLSATPPLLGYVGTSVKPTALQILRAPKEDDPVLATWQYGLGKSVAFTSDDRQRWAAGWLPWTGYSKFWSQAIRWSMRGATSGDLQTNVNIDRGRGQLTVEAVDSKGNFINFLDTKARLVTPDFKGQDLELEQTGPGRYEGDFDARQLGTYIINLRTGSGDNVSSQVTGAVVPYSPEYADVQSNDPLLASIAERTSGDTLLLPDDPAGDEKLAEQIFHRVREAARLPVDIWLTMLILAACLFPLDVAVRRLMWGEEELNHFAAYLKTIRPKRGAPKPKTQGPARRDETMGRLLKTKGSGSTGGSAMAPPPASGGAPAAPSAPGGTRRPSAGPPASAAPPPAKPATGPSEPRAEESEADLDPMERLRRAKRRARGEE